MTECTEWSQPDGDHFHGLCVNEFEPEVGSEGCPVCVSPMAAELLTCPMEWLASEVGELIRIPADLSIEFQSGDLLFGRNYVCNRTATPGTIGKTWIPELIGTTTPFPVVESEPFKRVWRTDWLPCGTRFASHKKINFATGATMRFYREDWNVDFRVSMQAGNGPSQPCFWNMTFEMRRTNNTPSGTQWWGSGTGIGPAGQPCEGWQLAGYSWGIPNGTVQLITGWTLDYKPGPAVPPYTPYLTPLSGDINRAKPVFNWRFGLLGCALHVLYPINSIEEEVVCEVGSPYDTCRSFFMKTYPRYTQGVADRDTCGVGAYPPWQPGIITMRMFEG